MAISGTVNTCQITTNTQFELSGLSESNLSTINITDENGLDVSECFGIETNIITVRGDNVTLSGDCDTSLEIKITEGVSRPVECNIIRTIQEGSGLVTFFYADGSSSDNTHPECCTALGFTPEIDPEKCYYVCRWRDEIDPEDCDNYQPIFQETIEGWQLFEFAGGGEVSTVPSADCCYAYNWVEEVQQNGEVKCIVEEPFEPCEGLVVVEPVPSTGIISFIDPQTNSVGTVVPNSECCISNGFNFQIVKGGFECYNSIVSQQPEVTISLDSSCCDNNIVVIEPPRPTGPCISYRISKTAGIGTVSYSYNDCDGVPKTGVLGVPDSEISICAIDGTLNADGAKIELDTTRFCQQ